jgi:hypothetical protein
VLGGGDEEAVDIPMADDEDEEEWELMHDQYSRLYRYAPSLHSLFAGLSGAHRTESLHCVIRLHEVARRVQIDVISGPFLQNMLNSQDSFVPFTCATAAWCAVMATQTLTLTLAPRQVLDVYQTIFVWCGRESTPNERSYAMLKAEELIGVGDRPRCCDISWAVDGAETIYFQEQFCDWTTAEWEYGIVHSPHRVRV